MESGTDSNLREEADQRRCRSGSLSCALDMALKSITGGNTVVVVTVPMSLHDKASATGLWIPLTCRMSDVDWDMKSKYLA